MLNIKLIRESLPLLAFGLLLTFFSSLGQTFLLSLYVPSIASLLEISNTFFGSLYAVATLSSAFTLPWLGGKFDQTSIRSYTIMVLLGLTAALFLLSSAHHIAMVFLAFFGLRLFGQGLMSHTAVSAMARYFNANRGKAIGIATLGHPIGEAILPLVVTIVIGVYGWRYALQFSAFSIVILILPIILLLKSAKSRLERFDASGESSNKGEDRQTIWQLLVERRFWIITPVVLMPGYFNTALFFFQLQLGTERGWSPEWVAGSLSAFALAGALGMAGSGPLVDRWSGLRLFPVYMIPYVIGLLILATFQSAIAYPVALLFLGLANGSGSTIRNAMLAEVYGIQRIGKVRSLFTTIIVFSTALGPITFGLLLDIQVSFSVIFAMASGVVLLAMLNGWRNLDH